MTTGQVRTLKATADCGHTEASCTSTQALSDTTLLQQQLGPSRVILVQRSERHYRVSAKDCVGHCSVSSYCLLSALVNLFHGAVKPGPKEKQWKPPQITAHVVCNQSPVQFSYNSVRLHTDDSDHWLQNISAYINFWRTALSSNIFLEESATNNQR